MKEIIQIAVVVLFAIPFVYMAFDIARDIVKAAGDLLKRYAKPAAATIFHVLSK